MSTPVITRHHSDDHSASALLGATAASFHAAAGDEEGDEEDPGSSGNRSSKKPRFDSVRRKQAERLQKRSDWFLSPPAGVRAHSLVQLGPMLDESESPALATSGPDILQSTSAQTPSESDPEFWYQGSLTRLGQPSSEPAIRRGVPTSIGGSPSQVDDHAEEYYEEEAQFEESRLEADDSDVATKYYVVERFYGPDLPPSPSMENVCDVESA